MIYIIFFFLKIFHANCRHMSIYLRLALYICKMIPHIRYTSRGRPLKVLTSATSRGPSRDSQGTNTKIDDLMKKLFFRCISSLFAHLFLFVTGKTNIQKVYMGTSTGRLRDSVAGRPGDQMMGRFGDVHGTSVIHAF